MRLLMLVCRDESAAFSQADRGTIGAQVQAYLIVLATRG
jgi:hypothetical protein